MVMKIVQIAGNLLAIVVVGFVFWMIGIAIRNSPSTLQSEYSTKVSVDAPDKIGNVISNAVSDLERRDFVPVKLEVQWLPTKNTYVIRIGGIDKTKLSQYEP